MPYEIKKKKCKMKSGESGEAVRYRKITHADGSVTLRKAACHKSVPAAYAAVGKIHDAHDPELLEDDTAPDSLLEAISRSERRDFERLARRAAQDEISHTIKGEVSRLVRAEVARAMKAQDMSAEIESTAETVIRRLMREMLK
jgi:hypothetical protein